MSAETVRTPARINVWQAIERQAAIRPGAVAVYEPAWSSPVDYGRLLALVEAFSAKLADAGVGPGDRVAVAARRGLPELVCTLATLRLGCACAPMAADLPPGQIRRLLAAVGASVIAGTRSRLAALGEVGRDRPHVVVSAAPDAVETPDPPKPADPDPDAPAFVLFDAEAPDPGRILRIGGGLLAGIIADSELLPDAARVRMLRHNAPDRAAGIVEALAPLVSGGAVHVLAQTALSPRLLADLADRCALTGLWLTAQQFRQVADFRADALRGVRQVLVDDEVPASATAAVARACPNLRITLCHSVAGDALLAAFRPAGAARPHGAPLLLGRASKGTRIVALDGRNVPAAPDAEGELCLVADGLALEPALEGAAQAESARPEPAAEPGPGRPVLRTGELARNRPDGGVEVTGRLDGRIRISGSWVSPEYVARVLRRHPEVLDAQVAPIPGGRLVGGVVVRGPERDPALIPELAAHAGWWLRARAVPRQWALLDEVPLRPDGSPDANAMARAATMDDPVHRAAREAVRRAEPAQSPAGRGDDIKALIRSAWTQLLEYDTFGDDDGFFDIGGSSVLALRLRDRLRTQLPDRGVTVQDIYRHQTVRQLAAHVADLR